MVGEELWLNWEKCSSAGVNETSDREGIGTAHEKVALQGLNEMIDGE